MSDRRRSRTVAVLFGGRSLEHDVSVVSGLQILHALDPERFAPMPVYIDQATALVDRRRPLAHRRFKGGGPDRSRLTEVTLSPGFGTSTLVPVAALPAAALAAASASSRRLRAGAARHVRRGRLRSGPARARRLRLRRLRRDGLGDRHEQAADEDRRRARRRADRAVAVVRAVGARSRLALADRAAGARRRLASAGR